MYLDTDVILGVLKADDWLSSAVDLDAIDHPKTSVSTCVEVQYAMENEWTRERVDGSGRSGRQRAALGFPCDGVRRV